MNQIHFFTTGNRTAGGDGNTGDSSMVQSTLKPLSFEQFLELYPEDGRYELVNGEIVRILSTRQHDKVAELISDALKQG